MANDDFEKLPITGKQLGYHKLVKTTSETSKTTREEHESRDDASGRYEKRLVASETRESKTSLSEIREPSAPARALPAAWRTSLPDKVRIRLRGVEPAGCADAEAFDGEYILELLESRAEQCRWELTLSSKCHLYRICLVAAPADGQAVELRAFFEGSEAAPGWKGNGRFLALGSRHARIRRFPCDESSRRLHLAPDDRNRADRRRAAWAI